MDPTTDSDSTHSSISSTSSLSSSSSSSTSSSSLSVSDFKLLRRIGTGDIGTVFLCHLRRSNDRTAYAMKVVDREMVAKKNKKMERADTERRVLKMLDHPFLPKLYADFDASPNHSCLVMEYCSGGDLHSLRHRMPGRRFSLQAARFYATEVLLSLEYLHMLGIVYRDLKPENILIKSDGHIMLSDFDLSIISTSDADVIHDSDDAATRSSSCFPFRFKKKPGPTHHFVAEPTGTRSNSFVGTHEYVAPEVASGRAHGSPVDWWAYGVLLFELIYGSTPFVGPTNETTLKNIVKKPLSFPATQSQCGSQAQDLITKLLSKDPSVRLGSIRGAADVKAHPFFRGVNFALMRSCKPPVVPGPSRDKGKGEPERFEFF